MKIEKYFKEITKKNLEINLSDIQKATNLILELKKKNKVILAGNGASSSISSHISIDLTKAANIRAINFNEANLLTCFSNDFGYENWMAEGINFYSNQADIVVLISVSGESLSVVNAAKKAKDLGLKVVTFSGRHESNALKKLGDINFWVDSHAYNIVECIHMIWLTSVIDAVIGKAEYEVS